VKVRTQARREAILEVARQVFLECGYERASMSEIARRVGGSKATLYGYFPSKEALFVAASLAEGKKLMVEAMADLEQRGTEGLRQALQRMGTVLVEFLSREATIAAHRMVLAESGRSDIGQMFYEQGPREGLLLLGRVLQAAMARGELRSSNPLVAAQHLHGLLTCEVQGRWFYRLNTTLTAAEAHDIAARAVDVFLGGYKNGAPIAD
jgi:AcrR family transcriptional regulator